MKKNYLKIYALGFVLLIAGSFTVQAEVIDENPATQTTLGQMRFDEMSVVNYTASAIDIGPDPLIFSPEGGGGIRPVETDGNGLLIIPAGPDTCTNPDSDFINQRLTMTTDPQTLPVPQDMITDITVWEAWIQVPDIGPMPAIPSVYFGITDLTSNALGLPDDGLQVHSWWMGTGTNPGINGGTHLPNLVIGTWVWKNAEVTNIPLPPAGTIIGLRIIIVPQPANPEHDVRYEYNLGDGWLEYVPMGQTAATLTHQSKTKTSCFPSHCVQDGLELLIANRSCESPGIPVGVDMIRIFNAQPPPAPAGLNNWYRY